MNKRTQQQGKPSRERQQARERKRAGLGAALAAIIAAVSAAVLTVGCDAYGLSELTDSQAAASGMLDTW